jgi:hypothetical protein
MKTLFICLLLILGTANFAIAEPPHGISGAVAYTEIMRFDYTKDGVKNRVQFWLEFKGRPAVGKPGDPDFTPEEGAIHYYLYDIDKKKKVANWLMGFSMMEGPPPSGPYPMTNIVIEGNTARFEAFGMKWIVIDGGENFAKDRLTVDDGFQKKQMRTYGGDLQVVSADKSHKAHMATVTTYAFNVPSQYCAACHQEVANVLASSRSKHTSLGCALCHPDKHKTVLNCQHCHGSPHPSHVMEKTGICGNCHNTAHDLHSGRTKR